jgi:hypothetical protein
MIFRIFLKMQRDNLFPIKNNDILGGPGPKLFFTAFQLDLAVLVQEGVNKVLATLECARAADFCISAF